MDILKLKNKKQIWILSLLALMVIVTIGGIMIFGKQDGYRTIKVFEVSGKVGVVKDGVEYEAYSGMVLTEGYSIVTSSDSYVRLALDGDKYIKLEEGSKATFEEVGMLGTGKTTINLERGAILSEIVNPLKTDESYIVNTPNAVLAVRGTLFKVAVDVNDNGESNTNVYTYGGAVGSKRIEPNGNVVDEQVIIDAGYKTTVKMDDVETIYVVENVEDANSSENREPINVIDISDEDMIDIYFASKNGHEMFITTDDIKEELDYRGIDITQVSSVYIKADNLENGKTITSINDGEQLADKNENGQDNLGHGILGDGTHRHEKVETVVEPTCLEEGKMTVVCGDCGEFMSERVLGALGHDEAEPVVIKRATCLEEGLQEINCNRCNVLISQEVLPITEHQELFVGTEEVHAKCMDCDTVLSTSHTYVSTVSKEATCKEQGELTYACDCGYHYIELTAKGEHKEKTTTVEATCTKDGKVTVSCEFCNTVYREEKIAATGHINEKDGGKENSHIECSDCGKVLSKSHSYSQTVVKQATCKESGKTKYTCACGYNYTVETPGGAHVKADANASESTCIGCGTKLIDFNSKNFPDEVFLGLLKDEGIDKNSDGMLDELEINAYTVMRFHYAGITDATGLQYFTELTDLELIGNDVSNIPFENLTNLQLINLGLTKITSADLTKLTNLYNIQLYGTGITTIDLSKNTELESLSLFDCTNLTSIDITNNKKLQSVHLQRTRINDFQISGYSDLQEVWLTECNMEKVRITNCPNLTSLELPNNVSTVDISGCTSLISLDLSQVKGTLYSFSADGSGLRNVIDLSGCTYLQEVSMNNCTGLVGINVSDCYSLSTLSVTGSSAVFINASNCLALSNPNVLENVYLVGVGTETVSYSGVNGFDSSKVTVISGGSFSDGVFYFDQGSTMIVYNYLLANDKYGQFIIKYN